mmetsp:Transcript_41232/g.84200  ORF Transcript_41232/g.84200 Transcript_41232/m.84200 type:complete len:201 (-) Transcript_41232:330-932(-)
MHRGFVHVTVLHHREPTILPTQQPHTLLRIRLLRHLATHVRTLADAVPNPQRIRHLAHRVVHSKGMDVLDATTLHVAHTATQVQRTVDATVPIWSLRHFGSALQHDLALRCEARQRTLREEHHCVGAKPEVVLLGEERASVRVRHGAGHDVPRQLHILERLPRRTRRQLAHALDLVGHDLEQRLVAGEAQVVLSLGSVEA